MNEPSPPPFIVIRTPRKLTAYEQALELAAMVHDIVAVATSRYYLKDRLDRAATNLVFALGKTSKAVPSLAWREYRKAQEAALEIRTVLDLFMAQRAVPADVLVRARTASDDLVAALEPGARG